MIFRSSKYYLYWFAPVTLSLVLCGSVLAQTFYKWKDAQGVTHYSETPPAKGNASQVQLTPQTPVAPSAAPAANATSAASQATALSKAEADYQKRACDAARGDVAAVQSRAMLVNGKDATSARKLNPDERVKAALDAQRRVNKFCATGKTP